MNKCRYIVIYIFLAFSIEGFGQDSKYEKIALNFFIDSILTKDKDYKDFKYIVFDGNINRESSVGFNKCFEINGKKVADDSEKLHISISNDKNVFNELNFFQRLFVAKRKIGSLEIFRHAILSTNKILVVIYFEGINWFDYISLVVEENGIVSSYCKSEYDE